MRCKSMAKIMESKIRNPSLFNRLSKLDVQDTLGNVKNLIRFITLSQTLKNRNEFRRYGNFPWLAAFGFQNTQNVLVQIYGSQINLRISLLLRPVRSTHAAMG